ncbi:MAG: zinc ribbon domain-containing protein [Clostridia bacterium]
MENHEVIVSREDFDKVQQLVGARYKKPCHNFENNFRGLIYCSDCGCKLNMGTKTKNGKHYHHYRCSNHYLNPDKCQRLLQISHNNRIEVGRQTVIDVGPGKL